MRLKDVNKETAVRKKTIEIIVKDGVDGLSMQKLAKAAKVSPATIYLYFKNRDDLITQVYLDVTRKMIEASLKKFEPEMHLAEGLRVQWANRARFCMRYPRESQFLEQLQHTPFHSKAIQAESAAFGEVMRKFITRAIERKEMIPFPSFEVFWAVVYAPLYLLVRFHQQGHGFNKKFVLTDEKMRQTLALVIKALTP